jgi:hypothetical protein
MNRALSLAEAFDKATEENNPNVNLGQRWADLFGVGVESPLYLSSLVVLYGSLHDLKNEIADANIRDKAKQLYTNAATHLQQFVSPAQVGRFNVNHLIQARDQINILHLAADTLPERLIPELQQPVLDDLLQQLDAILVESAKVNDDPDTARLVQTSIRTLSMVLESYKLLGPDGAARLYGAAMAELLRSLRQAPPEKAAAKSLVRKTLAVFKAAGYAVIFAGGVVHGADQLLTDGADVAAIVMGEPATDHVAPNDHAAPEAKEAADGESV